MTVVALALLLIGAGSLGGDLAAWLLDRSER